MSEVLNQGARTLSGGSQGKAIPLPFPAPRAVVLTFLSLKPLPPSPKQEG